MENKCACALIKLGAGLLTQVSKMEAWDRKNHDYIMSLLNTPHRHELDERWTKEISNPYHKKVAEHLKTVNDACGFRLEKPEEGPGDVYEEEVTCYPLELIPRLCEQLGVKTEKRED